MNLVDRILSLKKAKNGEPLVVALEGIIGSGKTYTASVLAESFEGDAIVLPMDFFCRVERSQFQKLLAEESFSPRDLYDFERIRGVLKEVRARKSFSLPECYNLATGKLDKTLDIHAETCELVVLEGLFSFDEELGDLVDIRIFVDMPEELALVRAEQRDRTERNANTEQWLRKKMLFHDLYAPYTEKARTNADIIHLNYSE